MKEEGDLQAGLLDSKVKGKDQQLSNNEANRKGDQ